MPKKQWESISPRKESCLFTAVITRSYSQCTEANSINLHLTPACKGLWLLGAALKFRNGTQNTVQPDSDSSLWSKTAVPWISISVQRLRK